MTEVTAQVAVDVADVTVVFHCDLEGDRSAYRITYDAQSITVYLEGTPEDLGRFADAIVRAVSRHTIETHERAIAEMVK